MEVTSAGGVNENLPQKFMNIIHEKKIINLQITKEVVTKVV